MLPSRDRKGDFRAGRRSLKMDGGDVGDLITFCEKYRLKQAIMYFHPMLWPEQGHVQLPYGQGGMIAIVAESSRAVTVRERSSEASGISTAEFSWKSLHAPDTERLSRREASIEAKISQLDRRENVGFHAAPWAVTPVSH